MLKPLLLLTLLAVRGFALEPVQPWRVVEGQPKPWELPDETICHKKETDAAIKNQNELSNRKIKQYYETKAMLKSLKCAKDDKQGTYMREDKRCKKLRDSLQGLDRITDDFAAF